MIPKNGCRLLSGGLNLTGVPQADSYLGLVHPRLQTALDSLEAYSRWVDEVLLPIAFDWIEEHHDEVYSQLSEEQRDDAGLVIAAAFELVKTRQTYMEGVEARPDAEARLRTGELDLSDFNPTWEAISQEVRATVETVFDQHKFVPLQPA